MPRIKLIEVIGHEYDSSSSSGGYSETLYNICAFSDWDEVTEEELSCLQFHARNYLDWGSGKKLIIIEERPVRDIMAEYLEKSKAAKEIYDSRVAKEKERREKGEAKRKLTITKKKATIEEKELALLNKLKEKYDGRV